MTTPSTAEPDQDRQASQFTRSLREPAAFVLIGADAVLLFVALIRLIPVGYFSASGSYFDYLSNHFADFVGLDTIFFPLLAVLLATHVAPAVARARLITIVALAELGISAFFGLFFGTFLAFVGDVGGHAARGAFESLFERLAYLAVLVTVGLAVGAVYRGLYYVPRPAPAPVPPWMYAPPGAHPQSGYPPSGYPQGYGHGQPGPPPAYAQHPGHAQHPGVPYGPGPEQPYGYPGSVTPGSGGSPPVTPGSGGSPPTIGQRPAPASGDDARAARDEDVDPAGAPTDPPREG